MLIYTSPADGAIGLKSLRTMSVVVDPTVPGFEHLT